MTRTSLNVMMLAIGTVLLAVVLTGSALCATPGEMLVRNSVRLALSWYTAALLLMMRLDDSDWSASSTLGRFARWCWTWGIACFTVHLVLAFQIYHFWSHNHAYQVTRDVSGVGEGIYTLYFFIAVWNVDTLWWWARPQSYASRSPRIDWGLHTFMLFIVFNGMVVFESGFIRWAGVLLFLILIWNWVAVRGLPARSAPRLGNAG